MKHSIRFFIGFSLLVLVVCYGCGVENSEVEMKAAQQAMDNAKNIHAEDFAASNWNEAMKTWEQAQAAVKEGKPAKTFFMRAKSRFEKTAQIAKPIRDRIAKEVTETQANIEEGTAKALAALEKKKLNSKAQAQVKAIVAEVKEGVTSIENLVSQGDYLKAKTTAAEISKKVYNAQLILAGKKPIP